MKVQDIMTRAVRTCGRSASLAEAAMIMWHNNCGIVPVVETDGKAVGVITDRDICMAWATRPLEGDKTRVGAVMTGQLFTCRPEDPVRKALQTMAHHKVRRLPVVDRQGRLVGVLSLNDLALHSGRGLPASAVLDTLRSICSHRKPAGASAESSPQPFENAWYDGG